MVKKIVLSLGTNLGDRSANLKTAAALIENRFNAIVRKSPVYETPPLYYEGPEKFYNCCIVFDSELGAKEVFRITSSIEKEMKRERSFPNAPRIIDIDIIFAGDEVMSDKNITVPHIGLQDRKFVLKPLSDLIGDFVHPALQATVNEMLGECMDKSKIKEIKKFWGN